jgi:hypothetical protein
MAVDGRGIINLWLMVIDGGVCGNTRGVGEQRRVLQAIVLWRWAAADWIGLDSDSDSISSIRFLHLSINQSWELKVIVRSSGNKQTKQTNERNKKKKEATIPDWVNPPKRHARHVNHTVVPKGSARPDSHAVWTANPAPSRPGNRPNPVPRARAKEKTWLARLIMVGAETLLAKTWPITGPPFHRLHPIALLTAQSRRCKHAANIMQPRPLVVLDAPRDHAKQPHQLAIPGSGLVVTKHVIDTAR